MTDFGSMSIMIDRKRSNSNPINIPRRKPAIWIPNQKVDNCFNCNTKFSFLNRKHHCRLCGRIFCNECSNYSATNNSLITKATPPKNMDTYLSKVTQWYNPKIKLCAECYSHTKTVDKSKELIIIFSNLPFLMIDFLKLREVNKEWCESINYMLSVYRSIQYKLPNQNFSKLEKQLLWNHRFEFKEHYYWISKCLTANKDKSVRDMAKLYAYYKDDTKKIYPCKKLLCRTDCCNKCKAEDILEIGYNIDLNKFEFLQVYIIELLFQKNNGYWQLLLPWIIELSKKYPKIGALLCIKTNDSKSLFNIYYELKYNMSFEYNKNYSEISKILKTKLVKNDLFTEIRKTDEFIKFIPLTISKINNNFPMKDIVLNVQSFFCWNMEISMPWNPHEKCVGIDLENIRQLNSSSKPYLVPFIMQNIQGKTYKKHILIKHEDIRKDKLTMCISKWITNICNEIFTIDTYNVFPISLSYGWIEMIDECETLYNIKHVHNKSLHNYLMDISPRISIEELRDNFIKTCVASCILCYILGVGDRHTENILINKYGDLVHIDFSYLLGEDPKINTEINITPEMLDMLGGKNSPTFIKFKNICSEAYKKIRRRSNLWYILLTYLVFSEPPIPRYYKNIELVKIHTIERLIPGELDEEGRIQIMKILDKSSESWINQISEYTHKIANQSKSMITSVKSAATGLFNMDL